MPDESGRNHVTKSVERRSVLSIGRPNQIGDHIALQSPLSAKSVGNMRSITSLNTNQNPVKPSNVKSFNL